MTNYMIMLGDDIQIFDITRMERHATMNVLKDKPTNIVDGLSHIIRKNHVSSIYVIESDGNENDLLEFYNQNSGEFISTVKELGRCIYAK